MYNQSITNVPFAVNIMSNLITKDHVMTVLKEETVHLQSRTFKTKQVSRESPCEKGEKQSKTIQRVGRRGPAGSAGPAGPTRPTGPSGGLTGALPFNPSQSQDYEAGQVVTFNGSTYIANVDAPSGIPGLSPDYTLLAASGETGPTGVTGITGATRTGGFTDTALYAANSSGPTICYCSWWNEYSSAEFSKHY